MVQDIAQLLPSAVCVDCIEPFIYGRFHFRLQEPDIPAEPSIPLFGITARLMVYRRRGMVLSFVADTIGGLSKKCYDIYFDNNYGNLVQVLSLSGRDLFRDEVRGASLR